MVAVSHADHAYVRVRSAIRCPGPLFDWPWTERAPNGAMLLTLTLVGDTCVSLFLTTLADRFGRRRVLIIGTILMADAGLLFASATSLLLLTIAGTIGVISPSGNESIDQAALSHLVPNQSRTTVFRVVHPGRLLRDCHRLALWRTTSERATANRNHAYRKLPLCSHSLRSGGRPPGAPLRSPVARRCSVTRMEKAPRVPVRPLSLALAAPAALFSGFPACSPSTRSRAAS